MAKILKLLTIDQRDDVPIASQMEMLGIFFDAVAQRNTTVVKLANEQNDAFADALREVSGMIDTAFETAMQPLADPKQQLAAVSLLGRDVRRTMDDQRALSALLSPRVNAEVQLRAVKAFGRMVDPQVPMLLLADWPSHSPALRSAIADVLISREPWAIDLLGAMVKRQVALGDLDLPRRERLAKHSSPKVRELAAKVLAATDTNRQDVIDANRSVLSLTGDRNRGGKVFATQCATCHRIENVGNDIGPSLASVANWSGEALLTAILDPDRQVEPRYLSYSAKLFSDNEMFGIITAETGGGITLKGLDAKEQTILRSNLKSLTCANHSLMPMGFEQAMNKQELADLISYLQTGH